MKKYTLNTENKPAVPNDDTIGKHKDFGALFHEYENFTKRPKKPLYKDPKYFLLLIIIAILSYVVYELINKDQQSKAETTQIDK